MSYDFDWNAPGVNKFSGAATVSINRSGLYLNSNAFTMLADSNPLMIGIDRRRFVIGIKAYDGNAHAQARAAKRSKGGGVFMGCRAISRQVEELTGRDHSRAVLYEASFDADSKTLIVNFGGVTHE